MGSHKCSLLFCPNYVSNYVTIIPKYKLAENLKRGGSGRMRRKVQEGRVGVKAPGPGTQAVCVRVSVCLSMSLLLSVCCPLHCHAVHFGSHEWSRKTVSFSLCAL